MNLMYRFPVVTFYEDDPEENLVEYCPAYITFYNHDKTSYESAITECGETIHFIFGQCQNDWFLCVPFRQFGCNLSDPSDISTTLYEMTQKNTDLDYEDATAIAYALAELSIIIRMNK